MIRDRVVMGVTSSKIREKLLNEGEKLTLDKSESHNFTSMHKPSCALWVSKPTKLLSMRSSREDVGSQPRRAERHTQKRTPSDKRSQRNVTDADYTTNNRTKGMQCLKYKKHNHFAVKCRTVTKVLEVEEDSDCDTFSVGSVETKSSKHVYADLQVGPNKSLIQFKLDTVACCNIISETEFKRLKVTAPLQKPKARLLAYTGAEIEVLGTIRLNCNYKAKKQSFTLQETTKTQS